MFNSDKTRNALKLEINKEELQSEITLPLLNYFEELKNGIISTNVDPQLSHGIESLKAQISAKLERKKASDQFELLEIKNNGNKTRKLEICDNQISIL